MKHIGHRIQIRTLLIALLPMTSSLQQQTFILLGLVLAIFLGRAPISELAQVSRTKPKRY